MLAPRRTILLVMCALGVLSWSVPRAGSSESPTPFAAEILRLSEPEGAFDTDNLISNERSYLDVIPSLLSRRVSGGVYIGVGPDQNFSYIARIRPAMAYIIDVRRDNLLLHLLFKAIFARAENRASYLSLLTGRAPPRPPPLWNEASLARIVGHVDATAPAGEEAARLLRSDLERTIETFGVALTADDVATIARFHAAFISQGLALRFNTHGRPPRPSYPTLRELLLATDAAGRSWSFLASERDYQFVRGLQARDLIVPVVGDVSGPHALRAIAAAIAGRGELVSAFYISNVETYLYRDLAYQRFVENVKRLPRNGSSVMIRSMFGGSSSSSGLQSIDDMLARVR
jgi:hypothetical protein